ncbi:MAG: single-stranded DNA-binding protein, partial [bacterium]|nr:single-stranded DNA-binding protein [bacterium]
MARSLNKVELIGNLTRDPELRYTPQGTAVCTFGVATNRSWTTDSGEKKEDAEFHKVVAWNKLAELCSQLLTKGRKVYVEGRLANRSWTGQDGTQKTTTEIVINDMLILDSRREVTQEGGAQEGSELPIKEGVQAEPARNA